MPNESVIKKMLAVGAHFGYSKTRNHPSTERFVFGFKNRQAVIDLDQTLAALNRAKEFIFGLGQSGQVAVWVGSKDEAAGVIRETGEGFGQPYVASRWIGGTLTNWPQIKSRLERLADLKKKRDGGELAVYTKKEQLLFAKEISRLERCFGTITELKDLPATLVVVDPSHESIAVAEARKVSVPIIALAGTDCDIRGVAYPIVANDGSVASIRFFVGELAEAYRRGRETPALDIAPAAAVAEAAV